MQISRASYKPRKGATVSPIRAPRRDKPDTLTRTWLPNDRVSPRSLCAPTAKGRKAFNAEADGRARPIDARVVSSARESDGPGNSPLHVDQSTLTPLVVRASPTRHSFHCYALPRDRSRAKKRRPDTSGDSERSSFEIGDGELSLSPHSARARALSILILYKRYCLKYRLKRGSHVLGFGPLSPFPPPLSSLSLS